MFQLIRQELVRRFSGLTRRELLRRSGWLGATSLMTQAASKLVGAPATRGLHLSGDLYQSICVRPLINCRGTLTIMGGSIELPEVRAAQRPGKLEARPHR